MKALRVAAIGVLVLFAAVFAGLLIAGEVSITPDKAAVGAPPVDLVAQSVSFEDVDGRTVHGWLVSGDGRHGTVILVHGIRDDRTSMLARTHFLSNAGYAVLLFDLQAHGESDGDHISFGFLESRSVSAAVTFVGSRFAGAPIAVIGVSLGGAAVLMADPPLQVDAMILEAVYSTLDAALRNRLAIRFGEYGPHLAPLLMWQVPLRLDYDPDVVAPAVRIQNVAAPLLVMSGDRDARTTLRNTLDLFANAPEPKELWMVPDAGHADLHRFSTESYERKVLDFLSRHLS